MDIMFPSNTSDFERGRVIAYRDSGLTYREIEEKTAVKQTTSRRLWDEWLELGKSTLTIGKDPRRHWVTRRVREEYEDGFVIPAVRQGKQVMAWGVIGYTTRVPSTVSTFKHAHNPSNTTSSVLSARHLQTASTAPNTPNGSYEGL